MSDKTLILKLPKGLMIEPIGSDDMYFRTAPNGPPLRDNPPPSDGGHWGEPEELCTRCHMVYIDCHCPGGFAW